MSIKPETIVQIQSMLQTDPALLAQVQSCADPVNAAAIIVKAAQAKGIEVSAEDVVAHAETATAQGALSDTALEQVAGGVNDAPRLSKPSLVTGRRDCAVVTR